MSIPIFWQGVAAAYPVWNPDWVPDFVFVQSYEFDTIITDGNLGPEVRRPRRVYSVANFSLNFASITKALATSIYAFYVDRQGSYKQFTWANPVDGTSYSVRFLEDSLMREEIGEDAINMEVKLKQVL